MMPITGWMVVSVIAISPEQQGQGAKRERPAL